MCMVSVGHLARAIEATGVPTVVVYPIAFRSFAEVLKPPRALLNHTLMGRPIGLAMDNVGQRAIVRAALKMLEEASEPGTIREFAG
jgi:hypothetical protein